MWQAQPTYRSTVDILVDPRARTVVGMDVVPAGLGSSSQGSNSGLVDSQVQLLQSRVVLGTVIDKLGLDQLAEPSSAPSLMKTLSSGLKAILYGPNRSDFEGASAADRALSQLQSSLRIERLGNTYVLRVSVSSRSPQSAADIANAVAQAYVEQGQDAINAETRTTADALESRLSQLKQNSDDAQQALEKYRSDNGLLNSQGVMVDEQQLRDLNDQVTRASVDTEAARARLAEIDRLKDLPASALASTNTLSSPGADAIRTQLDAAVADENSLSALYGPQHPTLILAQHKRMALETALLQEFRRIETRAASDYKTAQNAEQSLKTLLSQYETRRSTSNEAAIRLRELQAAADAARSIYDAFSLRAAQTREQIDLPTNTSRIISAAEPSSQPSDPRLPVVLATSLAVGLLVGVGLAWCLHLIQGGIAPWNGGERRSRKVHVRTAPAQRNAPETRSASARDAILASSSQSKSPRPEARRSRPLAGLFR